MRNLKQLENRKLLFVVLSILIFAGFLSCSGEYAARRVNVADDKIAFADKLFSKGKYSQAAAEYKDFLAKFAGDERCDYAQFRLAESYRLDKEYALAAVEYRILINDYGYSDYVDDAFFLEALCIFKQSPRAERDQTKTYEALDRVKRFLSVFPNSPRKDEALKLLNEIKMKLGKKEFLNAKLYISEKKYKAALIYLNKVINLYSDTGWAARSHYYKGMVLEKMGKLAEALDEYEKALSSDFPFKEKEKAAIRIKSLNKEQS